MIRRVVRLVVLVVAAGGGAWAARELGAPVAVGLAAGALAGAVAVLLEMGAAAPAMERLVWGTAGGLLGAAAGLIVGLAIVGLVPEGVRAVARALAVLLGVYVGTAAALARLADLEGLSARLFPPGRRGALAKVLDTSAIIDGRIADICETGFVDGPLVVPRFVLAELQRVADSSDGARRNRGRRGFEVLQRLQRLPGVAVEIAQRGVEGTAVDEQLIEFARACGGKIVTNDYNLNKLAELRGVPVLNVNELAHALRPVVLPGETVTVQALREGKEPGQGVGYLDDGTMVVIEQGKRFIGQPLDVVVTSVLQTPAGRMIFTRAREEAPLAHDA